MEFVFCFPAAVWPWDDSTSNRYEYQKMYLGSRAWPAHKADNFTTICEQMSRKRGILSILQPYRPSWALTGIGLLYLLSSFYHQALQMVSAGSTVHKILSMHNGIFIHLYFLLTGASLI
jgi:hypothetical protein